MAAYTETEMVKMMNRRDSHFFSVLHETFFRRLYLRCRKLGIPSMDAEEIVSDLLARMYTINKDKQFESWVELRKYLYKAVRNNCITHLKRMRTVDNRMGCAMDAMTDWDVELDVLELHFREAVWASNSAKLWNIFETTSFRSLHILRMLYFEGKTVREIAEHMDITEQTVRNHKTKGLDKMAEILRDQELTFCSMILVLYLFSML